MVGLSRTSFYQLIGTAFPFPLYDMATKRPYYPPNSRKPVWKCGGEISESTASRSFSTGGKRSSGTPKRSGKKTTPDDTATETCWTG